MATTLARRIRRIGILPSTYKELNTEYLEHNKEGAEVVVTRTKRIAEQHFEKLPKDVREQREQELRTTAKAHQLVWRATRATRSAK